MQPLTIGDTTIEAGERKTVMLSVAPLYTNTDMAVPVEVVRGKKEGPTLFVSAAIHGDEINGVEIVRRLLGRRELRSLRGSLLAVPVVNVYGYTGRTRYLPDRRDLNRSFPGSARGSMASRLAHTFMEEIVQNATHGIDLHTGAIHRTNLPHVRACLDEEGASSLAKAFGAPVIMHANLRDGSLRQAVLEHNIPVLLYEAGEALRFDQSSITAGLRGILRVMRHLEMLPKRRKQSEVEPIISMSSTWVRAPDSGTLIVEKKLGAVVRTGDVIGRLFSPLGEEQAEVTAPDEGVIIGQTTLPLVYEGDALFHVALIDRPGRVRREIATFNSELKDFAPQND